MKSSFETLPDLLSSYPRTRPPLDTRYQQLYVAEYKKGRSGGEGLPGVVARVEAWMHKQVASAAPDLRILELGAGTLNHVSYENKPEVYDVVEPFSQLWQDSPRLAQISIVYQDISQLAAANRYDRIISVAVLEHLVDLPLVIADCGLRLADSGEFRAGIPTEGGFLWSLGWRSTTGLSFRLRTGLSYEPYIRHEHVNVADEIITIMGYFFQRVDFRHFPFPMKHLSLYTALRASSPYLDRCAAFKKDRTVVSSAVRL